MVANIRKELNISKSFAENFCFFHKKSLQISLQALSLPLSRILAAEGPAVEHGEVVDRVGAVLLYGHRPAYLYPASGLVAGDADGLVGGDVRESAHVPDLGLGLVLDGRSPLADDGADGKQPVLVVVGAG